MNCLQSSSTLTSYEVEEAQAQAQINKIECVICYSIVSPRLFYRTLNSNVIFIPCGHYQICQHCVFRLQRKVSCTKVVITNDYLKYLKCPSCLKFSAVLKLFPNKSENFQCTVCKKTKEIDSLIIPCFNFSVCYDCCLNFVSKTNQSEFQKNEIYVHTNFSIICPICKAEGIYIW